MLLAVKEGELYQHIVHYVTFNNNKAKNNILKNTKKIDHFNHPTVSRHLL